MWRWTHVRFAAISPPYKNMWSGSTGPTLPSMQVRQEYTDIRDTRGLVGWCEANLDAPIVTGKISYTYARVLASARGFTPRPREQPARQEPGLWCADSYLQRAVADVDRKTKVIVPLWRHKTGKDTMGQISGKARLLRRTILPGRIS